MVSLLPILLIFPRFLTYNSLVSSLYITYWLTASFGKDADKFLFTLAFLLPTWNQLPLANVTVEFFASIVNRPAIIKPKPMRSSSFSSVTEPLTILAELTALFPTTATFDPAICSRASCANIAQVTCAAPFLSTLSLVSLLAF